MPEGVKYSLPTSNKVTEPGIMYICAKYTGGLNSNSNCKAKNDYCGCEIISGKSLGSRKIETLYVVYTTERIGRSVEARIGG